MSYIHPYVYIIAIYVVINSSQDIRLSKFLSDNILLIIIHFHFSKILLDLAESIMAFRPFY